MGSTIKLHVIKTSRWKLHFLFQDLYLYLYSYSSLKIFENKVVNKGKTELTDATHDLYTLLTAIFQE